jgi:hypothetical protein
VTGADSTIAASQIGLVRQAGEATNAFAAKGSSRGGSSGVLGIAQASDAGIEKRLRCPPSRYANGAGASRSSPNPTEGIVDLPEAAESAVCART